MQVYVNIFFGFEPADCFCSKLITVQRWIQDLHITGFMDLSLTINMYINAKIRIYLIYFTCLKSTMKTLEQSVFKAKKNLQICSKPRKTPKRLH